MNNRLVISCPTRNQPQMALETIRSACLTSKAEIWLYIDEDQRDLYRGYIDGGDGWKAMVGPRIGPAKANNAIIDANPGAAAYGWVDDNARFMTPGWDEYVLDELNKFPGRIGVVSAHHNSGPFVNFACVSNRWVETIGWLAYPEVFHMCWDTILEMLGEATQIVYAPEDKFRVEHHPELSGTPNRAELFKVDSEKFLWWCVGERYDLVKKLRAAAKE